MPTILAILVILVLASLILASVVKNVIYICPPNEVIVFSGGRGGYRIIKGGSAIRNPLIEVVDRLDLTNMPIEVSVANAYSKGGIPLNVQGVANCKISGVSPILDNALSRLLDMPRKAIMQMARETLEGNLRGVLATLTPEQVNEDKESFARTLQEHAEHDLHRLGLELDTLKIQNVADDVGYLNSIGRKRSADVRRKARIAEAQNRAEAAVKAAENKQRAELAQLEAQLRIIRAEAERRTKNAETGQLALVAEQQGEVQALVTRARADLNLQDARVKQVRSKLAAEVIAPARARMEADVQKARGDAARIVENGRATADALASLAVQWRKAGPNAKDVFLLQKLDTILPTFLSSIRRVRVDRIAMVQSGGAASQALSTVEALEAGLGVEVGPALRKLLGQPEPVPAAAAPAAVDAQGRRVK